MWKWCFQMFHRLKFTYYLYVPKTRFRSLSFVSHVQKANYPRKDFHMKAHMTDRNSRVMLLTCASYPAWSLLVKWLYEMGSCFKFWFLFGLSSYFSIMGWIQRWNCIQMHTSFGIKSLKQPMYSWTTIHHLRIVERSTKCNSNWQEHHPGTHKLLCGCCKDSCSRVGALEEHKQNAFSSPGAYLLVWCSVFIHRISLVLGKFSSLKQRVQLDPLLGKPFPWKRKPAVL